MVDAVVGRERIVAEALIALEQRRPVLLFGPEGIGKTRLATELAGRFAAQKRRRVILRGTPENARLPFGTMLHLLDLLHLFGPDVPLDGGSESVRSVAEHLRSSDATVVVADDINHFDSASAAVVSLVADHGTPRLIMTSRADELPLSFGRMVRDRNALAIKLEPLADSDIQVLMERCAGQRLSFASSVRLAKLASGIPLHAIELIRVALASGALKQSGESLALTGNLPVTELRALVGHRLIDMSTECRRALELVSLGEPVEAAVIVSLTSADAVSSLIDRGLIGERPGERQGHRELLFTSYPLVAELVLAGIPAFRRSMHLLDLADGLAQHGRGGPDEVARQLLWTTTAGRDVSPAELASTASEVNLKRLHGFVTAIGSTAANADRFDDGTRLLASALRDRYEEAVQLASLAYERDPSVTNGFGVLRTLMSSDVALDQAAQTITRLRNSSLDVVQDAELRRLGRIVHAYHRGDADSAMEIVAWAPVPSGNEEVVVLETAVVGLYTGDVDRAADRLQISVAQPTTHPFLEAVSRLELAVARSLQARPEDASALVDEAFPIALSNGAEASFAASLWWIKSLATAYEGRLSDAEAMLLSAFNASVSADSIEGAGFFADGLATVARLAGRYRTAVRRGRRSADLLTVRDVGQLHHALGEWGVALCCLGEAVEARRVLDRIREARPRRPTGRAPLALLGVYVDLVEGKRLTTPMLNAAWEELGGLSTQTRVDVLWVGALSGSYAWAAQRAGELKQTVQGALNLLYLDAAEALDGNDVDVFDDVIKRAIEMSVPVVAAVVASVAADRTSRSSVAASYRAIGVEQHRLTEGAKLLGSSTGSAELSRREELIATLAGQSMTDAAIAVQLGLSVRTVESHLNRIYRKLGVNSRRDLAGWKSTED